ncbi:MAG: DUF167 domain-containing protein [Acidobacteria bacterium]|nr:DUF167 domain-containing protein [Acidobacteriota bacterium]
MIRFTSGDGDITFSVRVQPRASRSGVAGEMDGALKVRLNSPPVDGEANDELVRLLAKIFSIPRARISLLSGQTSRSKLIRLEGVSAESFEEVINKLGVDNA